MPRAKPRKRPCQICRKWFLPNPRQKERQRTCGDSECQRELHRRNCQEWNKKNSVQAKENFLSKKLERIESSPDPPHSDSLKKMPPPVPKSRIDLNLPKNFIADKIGLENLVILEYIVEQIVQRNIRFFNRQPP